MRRMTLVAIVAVTALGFLERIFSTVTLSFSQWWICIGIAASLVLVEELIKVFVRRRARREAPSEEGGVSDGTT